MPNCGARFQGHLVRAKKKKEEMVLGLKKLAKEFLLFPWVWSSETKHFVGGW